jgi:ribosome-associated protein
MNKKDRENQLNYLKETIVSALDEKKATDIVSLDFTKLNNPISDMFIICSGSSKRQVEALADYVNESVRKLCNEKPNHIEGMDSREWILLDYFNIIVHIFVEEKREFFAIEELWGDGELIEY